MKKLISILLFAMSLAAYSQNSNPTIERQLLQMLDKKDIFRLETVLEEKKSELSQSLILYFEAHLQNAFNQTEQSLQTIDILLSNHGKELNDTLLRNVFFIKYDNLHKQTRYREATEALEIAMSLDSSDFANWQGAYNIVAALKEFPSQKIHISTDVTIPISRNQFNHVIMQVMSGGQLEDFIFDSGAMLSTVSESCAKRMGIHILESSVDVGNSIGSTVQSKVGVADSLWIGDLLFENVAFLVLPDEGLSFPEINYTIHGIIGFPVMYQMKEVVIRKDESLTVVARPTKRNLHNLFLDGLSPIVQFEANSDTVLVNMDTGANTTEFSEKYFTANKDKIAGKATLKTEQQGGAGGIVNVEVYELENVQIKIGGRELTIPTITVRIDKLSLLDENYDGNLGQNILMYFNKLILNFENMYLAFED